MGLSVIVETGWWSQPRVRPVTTATPSRKPALRRIRLHGLLEYLRECRGCNPEAAAMWLSMPASSNATTATTSTPMHAQTAVALPTAATGSSRPGKPAMMATTPPSPCLWRDQLHGMQRQLSNESVPPAIVVTDRPIPAVARPATTAMRWIPMNAPIPAKMRSAGMVLCGLAVSSATMAIPRPRPARMVRRAAPSVVGLRTGARASVSYCGDGVVRAPKARAATMVIPTPRPARLWGRKLYCVHRDCQSGPGDVSYCGRNHRRYRRRRLRRRHNARPKPAPMVLKTCSVCTAGCTQGAGTTAYCGDGIVDAGEGEARDDGNDDNTDGCVNCEIVSCGDGVIQPGEACDDGNSTTESCAYGEESCTVCAGDCRFGPGTASYCGDGVRDADNGEACDDGNDVIELCTYSEKLLLVQQRVREGSWLHLLLWRRDLELDRR